MKNGLLLFAGAFALLAFSWAGVVLTANHQLGGLTQYKDPIDESLSPAPLGGLADQGRAVYQDLGCVSCHTQQVRREGFGADIGRKWGERQSVARDYVREKTVLIGSRRFGPDLRNVGGRSYADADFFYKLLYDPHTLAPGMPAHAFLFEIRRIAPGGPRSDRALSLPAPAGCEIIPTRRAEALVAYLLSLKDTYEYPEARPFAETEKKEGAAK